MHVHTYNARGMEGKDGEWTLGWMNDWMSSLWCCCCCWCCLQNKGRYWCYSRFFSLHDLFFIWDLLLPPPPPSLIFLFFFLLWNELNWFFVLYLINNIMIMPSLPLLCSRCWWWWFRHGFQEWRTKPNVQGIFVTDFFLMKREGERDSLPSLPLILNLHPSLSWDMYTFYSSHSSIFMQEEEEGLSPKQLYSPQLVLWVETCVTSQAELSRSSSRTHLLPSSSSLLSLLSSWETEDRTNFILLLRRQEEYENVEHLSLSPLRISASLCCSSRGGEEEIPSPSSRCFPDLQPYLVSFSVLSTVLSQDFWLSTRSLILLRLSE